MSSPKTEGRMINKSVSDSDNLPRLSADALALFFLLIPHYNSHGKMNGGPGHIKDEVVPKFPQYTYENLPVYLKEISDCTSVKWFRCGGRWWLHSLNFLSKHQKLDPKKLGRDLLPSYSGVDPEQFPGDSETGPELVAHEVEGEVEVEGEEKASPQVDTGELPAVAPPQEAESGRAGETCSQIALRKAVHARMAFIREHWPDVDIALETERMVAKARDRPVIDPVQYVLAWFPRAKAARGALSAEQVHARNQRTETEFLQEVRDG